MGLEDEEEADTQSVSKKLADFLTQLETLDTATAEILKTSKNSAVNICLSNLCAMAKAASLLLQQLPPQIESLKKEVKAIPEKIKIEIAEEVRHRSIVISNVPEINSTQATSRAKSDRRKIEAILDHLEIEEIPIATFRMGQKSEEQGRPRLMKVIFAHRGAALATLMNRGKLKSYSVPKIYIRESLPRAELDEINKKLEEKRRLNAALGETELKENPYIVYAGRLIRRNEIPPRPAQKV